MQMHFSRRAEPGAWFQIKAGESTGGKVAEDHPGGWIFLRIGQSFY
jgi:hypothetical protein